MGNTAHDCHQQTRVTPQHELLIYELPMWRQRWMQFNDAHNNNNDNNNNSDNNNNKKITSKSNAD